MISLVLSLTLLGPVPVPQFASTVPTPHFESIEKPAGLVLETPETIKTQRLVNPWAGYSAGRGCNCVMCQTIRKYGSQKYAVSEVPFDPTPPEGVEAIIEAAELTPDDVLYDLGSGDGRIVIAAAVAGARGVGVEIEPTLVDVSERNAATNCVAHKVRIYRRDATSVDLSQATVVTLYQDERLLAKLRPRLEQLQPGTRVISYAHPIPGWTSEPWRTADGVPIYRWTIKAKPAVKACGPNGCPPGG